MRGKWLWAALALVAVLGITTAASATTRGLITGKMIAPHSINSKKLVDHTIQKHDLSTKLVTSLHGAKGARGATGPQGPRGLTNVVERRGGGDLSIVSQGSNYVDPTHVLTIHLGEGNWLVAADGEISNDAGWGIISCRVFKNGDFANGYVADTSTAVGDAVGYTKQQAFAMQGTTTLAAPADLELGCVNYADSNPVGHPNLGVAHVIATQVDRLSVSHEP